MTEPYGIATRSSSCHKYHRPVREPEQTAWSKMDQDLLLRMYNSCAAADEKHLFRQVCRPWYTAAGNSTRCRRGCYSTTERV